MGWGPGGFLYFLLDRCLGGAQDLWGRRPKTRMEDRSETATESRKETGGVIRLVMSLTAGVVLVFDGACREGNPGRGSFGYAIYLDGEETYSDCQRVPFRSTSNQTEYMGLVHGLDECRQRGLRDVTVVGDSQLVIRQMSGVYRCWSRNLQPLHRKAAELAKEIGVRSWEWRPRSDSLCARADELANRAFGD